MNFKDTLSKAKQDINDAKNSSKRKKSKFNIKEVAELFKARLDEQMALKGKDEEFIIDDDNKDLINNLIYYIMQDKRFIGNPNKGILVIGTIGTGKTMIMQAFCQVWEGSLGVRIRRTSAKKYVDFLKDPSQSKDASGRIPDYAKGELFFDDIFKESKKINDYGTEVYPVVDLLSERYDQPKLTFMTGNYRMDTMAKVYGDTVIDRMTEMFNIIILKGKSRRV